MVDVKFSALVRGAFGGERYAHHDIMVTLGSSEVRVWDPANARGQKASE